MIAGLIRVPVLGITVGLVSFFTTSIPVQGPGTIVVEGKPDKNNRKVCRSTAPPTGTRLGQRRICRTAAEWKMIEQRSQETIDRSQLRQRAVEAQKQNAKNGLAQQGPP